jgi:predicted ATP-grasp superfamily ATP-dependent carboligase
MPASDVAVALVAEHAAALAERYLFPSQPVALVHTLINKQALHETAARLAVPTPRALLPRSDGDVREFLDTTGLPVVAKSVDPRLPHGTAKAVLHDRADVLAYWDGIVRAGGQVIFQEFIPGGEAATWMFNAYVDHRSECLVAFTGRKIRQYPATVGVASLGVCENNPYLVAVSRRFLRELGYRGMVDIDYRHDGRDGSYKILDVNPRIGATFRLFVDDTGLDVARCCYLDTTGQPVSAGTALQGRRWMLEEDVMSGLRQVRAGTLTLGQWAASLRGVRETAWWARDDMRPLFARVQWGLWSGRRTRRLASVPARWGAEDYEPSTSR